MAYPRGARIEWDPPDFLQGVNIYKEIGGVEYGWRVPHNGLVPQALAADLLGVSIVTVNTWVRAGKMHQVKPPGQPSAIPLSVVKTFKRLRAEGGDRLLREWSPR